MKSFAAQLEMEMGFRTAHNLFIVCRGRISTFNAINDLLCMIENSMLVLKTFCVFLLFVSKLRFQRCGVTIAFYEI